VLKKILLIIAMLYTAVALAAVDVNKASEAELDGIKGIGPGVSSRILEERKSGGDFKDWSDFIGRVNGVGEKSATRFSTEGLTVNGRKFSASAAAKKAQKERKEASKKVDKAASATKN
jgi:competence protein ComEA